MNPAKKKAQFKGRWNRIQCFCSSIHWRRVSDILGTLLIGTGIDISRNRCHDLELKKMKTRRLQLINKSVIRGRHSNQCFLVLRVPDWTTKFEPQPQAQAWTGTPENIVAVLDFWNYDAFVSIIARQKNGRSQVPRL